MNNTDKNPDKKKSMETWKIVLIILGVFFGSVTMVVLFTKFNKKMAEDY